MSAVIISDTHFGLDSSTLSDPSKVDRLMKEISVYGGGCDQVILLGDIFDFWFEYKTVVPRGFTRLLGKLSEITDSGIEVHFFIGNHDIWLTDYLQNECGLIIHRKPLVTEIFGKKFFIASHIFPLTVDCNFKLRSVTYFYF